MRDFFIKERVLPSLLVLSLCFAFCSCSSSSWLGTDDKAKAVGERISVFEHNTSLSLNDVVENPDIILPAPEPTSGWPQAGGYSHHDMGHLFLNDNFSLIWEESVGEGASDENFLLAEPVVANDIVYALDSEGTLSAFSLLDGENLWESTLHSKDKTVSLKSAGLAYDGGVIFTTSGNGDVHAFNAKNGKLIWHKTLTAPIRSAPTVYGARVFVPTIDNRVTAFSGYTGEVLWSYDLITENTTLLGSPAPTADKGILIVPFSSGEIYALKTDTGVPVWSDTVISGRARVSSVGLPFVKARPVINDNIVYTIGNDGMVTATNLFSGTRIWEKEISGTNQIWVAGKYLFLQNDKNELLALQKEDGKLLWQTKLPMWEDEEDNEDRIFWTGPILAKDKLILVSSHGFLLAFSPYTGAQLFQKEIGEGVMVPPVIVKDTMLLLDNEGYLKAYK